MVLKMFLFISFHAVVLTLKKKKKALWYVGFSIEKMRGQGSPRSSGLAQFAPVKTSWTAGVAECSGPTWSLEGIPGDPHCSALLQPSPPSPRPGGRKIWLCRLQEKEPGAALAAAVTFTTSQAPLPRRAPLLPAP